jgi:hypothetical protein
MVDPVDQVEETLRRNLRLVRMFQVAQTRQLESKTISLYTPGGLNRGIMHRYATLGELKFYELQTW